MSHDVEMWTAPFAEKDCVRQGLIRNDPNLGIFFNVANGHTCGKQKKFSWTLLIYS